MCMIDEVCAKRNEIYVVAKEHGAKSFGCSACAHARRCWVCFHSGEFSLIA